MDFKLSDRLFRYADMLDEFFPFDIRATRLSHQLYMAAEDAITLEQIEKYWKDSVDASWKNSDTILKAVLAGAQMAKGGE